MGIYIYSFIVTLVLLFTNWFFIFYKPFRPDIDRSSDFDRVERELQKSRATVDRAREALTECRRILNSNEQGVEGVIERLRGIAEKVKILEDLLCNSDTT